MSTAEYIFRKLLPNTFRRIDILIALHKKQIELVEKQMQEDLNG